MHVPHGSKTTRRRNEQLKPSLLFFVLKTQIEIRPQPLVYDLSMVCVCVIWVISIEAECYIYARPKATQTVLFTIRLQPSNKTLRKHFCPLLKKRRRLRHRPDKAKERNASPCAAGEMKVMKVNWVSKNPQSPVAPVRVEFWVIILVESELAGMIFSYFWIGCDSRFLRMPLSPVSVVNRYP